MTRIILSTAFLMSAIPSFANVQSCKTSVAMKEEPVVKKPAVDVSGLDDLIAELTAEKVATTVSPEVFAEVQKTKPFDKDPRAMNLNEILHSLGLEPYYTRLASAELVRQTQNDHHLQLGEEIQALFEAITTDDLTERQKLHLASYKKVIDQIISNSKVVRRHKIILGYDESPPPQSVEDLFISQPTATAAPVKKPSFFAKLFGGGSKKKEVGKAVVIPYENPVQYARTLLERPSTERIEIIRQQVDQIGLLSHLEIYRILMAIPSQQQTQVYQMLTPNLIGRIDFYPFEVLKDAADIDSVATLDTVPIVPEIILTDLRETGKNLDIFEVYNFLRVLDFKSSDISTAMIARKLTFEQLSKFAQAQGHTVPFDDMLAFIRIFVHSSPDLGTIEKGRSFLKTVFPDPDLTTAIDHYFDREIRETAFRVQQMIAMIHPESFRADELYEKISLIVGELQYLKPSEAAMFLQLIPSDPFYLAEGAAIANLRDVEVRFYNGFREGIRNSPFNNDRDKKWTSEDLPFLHVSKNLDLAHKILMKIRGSMTEELRSEIGAEVLRQINRSNLYEPEEGELNPLKVNKANPDRSMRPPRKRGVSAAVLKEYLFYRISNL